MISFRTFLNEDVPASLVIAPPKKGKHKSAKGAEMSRNLKLDNIIPAGANAFKQSSLNTGLPSISSNESGNPMDHIQLMDLIKTGTIKLDEITGKIKEMGALKFDAVELHNPEAKRRTTSNGHPTSGTNLRIALHTNDERTIADHLGAAYSKKLSTLLKKLAADGHIPIKRK